MQYNWVLDETHYPDWATLRQTAGACQSLVCCTSSKLWHAGSVGARLMVYVNPFLIWTPTVAEGGNATRNLYDEANYYGAPLSASALRLRWWLIGYLVKYSGNTSTGWYSGPYLSLLITREGAMLDLSNPYAVAWFQQVLWLPTNHY